MIRLLQKGDIPRVLVLTNSVGWSYEAADIERVWTLSPKGCFVVEMDGEPVGFTSAISYGQRGFIGNVVIEESKRKTSFGRELVKEAISYLRDNGGSDIRLYSYTHVEKFYERMGFKPGDYLATMKRAACPVKGANPIPPMSKVQLNEACAHDRNIWHGDRSMVLECHRSVCGELAMAAEKGGGYIFGRGSPFSGYEVGPYVSCGPAGDALLEAFVGKAGGSEIWATAFEANERAVGLLRSAGFVPSFRTREMALGTVPPASEKDIITVAGLELG